MKSLFIFLLLILIINCIPTSTNEEKRRKEAQNKMVDCILKSQNGSEELKNK